jgi:GWxTD domain-containing protein
MTREEQRAWRNVQTDEQAQNFIDLFWARRDPTPGTYANEFRAEFESRVKWADENFKDNPRLRGSLTDRGRAYVVLGSPTVSGMQFQAKTTMAGGGTGTDANSQAGEAQGARMGARDEWTWNTADAKKFGMPRVYIVFIQDPISGIWQRDPQRTDFILAQDNAIRLYIHNPELTSVPDWAKPKLVMAQVEQTKKLSQQAAAPEAKVEPGLKKLLLVKDVMSIPNAQQKADPFSVAPAASFSKGDDLGYAFQYCGTADTVKVTITITGMSEGKKVRMVTPADDATPDPMRAAPGCGMVRASIPLSSLTLGPGTYTFSVKVEDGAQSYNLAQDFRIE